MFLWWGLAAKTRNTYTTATRSYKLHCVNHGFKPMYPASLYGLSDWIARLDKRYIKLKTIKAYLNGVYSVYIDIDFNVPEIFKHPALLRIRDGIRCRMGEADI